MSSAPSSRCRLVLIAPVEGDVATGLPAAIQGGDVASVILPQGTRDEAAFQHLCEAVVPALQQAGIAVMLAGDSRIAGRVKADGLHFESGPDEVAEALDRHGGRLLVGATAGKNRDEALRVGELQPDYVFFGRIGYDTAPEPHPRNLSLAAWWAEMVSVPCIVQGGSDVASVVAAAKTGADFVALSAAIFAEGVDPAAAVREANALLEAHAPAFEEAADA